MTKKSLFFTYFLWLFGGIFGLHHFYLGRDFHAFVWWSTLGGYLGAGWFRDLWRIPEYVQDANEDPVYMAKLAEEMRKFEKPPTGYVRYFGQTMVSDIFAVLVLLAVPEEYLPEKFMPVISALLAPAACALGVYLVGNIGRHEGGLLAPLIGAYITSPLYFVLHKPIFVTVFCSCYGFNTYSKQWKRTPPLKRTFLLRISILFLCAIIYISLFGSFLYFNCELTYEEQEQVKCRDAAKHFFRSPMWKEFKTVMKSLWDYIQVHGWRATIKEIVEAFDPIGEKNALKVLELPAKATEQQITAQYRKLSREWHPDKHKNPEDKQIAEEKFIEIQQAYEILSKIKTQRMNQNIKIPGSDQARHSDEL